MTTLIKTVPVSELPPGWQAELGLGNDKIVRVEICDVPGDSDTEVRARLMRELKEIKPIEISGSSTDFIRAERDRLDGRDP